MTSQVKQHRHCRPFYLALGTTRIRRAPEPGAVATDEPQEPARQQSRLPNSDRKPEAMPDPVATFAVGLIAQRAHEGIA